MMLPNVGLPYVSPTYAGFDIWISEETITEITNGNYPRKTEIVQFISAIPVLPSEPQIIEIAQINLENDLMPRVLKGDAMHLA